MLNSWFLVQEAGAQPLSGSRSLFIKTLRQEKNKFDTKEKNLVSNFAKEAKKNLHNLVRFIFAKKMSNHELKKKVATFKKILSFLRMNECMDGWSFQREVGGWLKKFGITVKASEKPNERTVTAKSILIFYYGSKWAQ